MKTKRFFWPLQENAVDKKNTETLIKFIKTSDQFTQSSQVKKFEKAWSKWQGCKYSIFLNSGSSGIFVIFAALKEYFKWENDLEVIVPAVTWITDISVILQLGLKPVFVDVNLEDFSFDYADLEKKITSKTKTIFLTDLLGFPSDVNKIKNIVGKKKIHIIEDCCEAHGAKLGNKKVGNFGLASVFSFYWGHHMTTVEGGMVSTNNKDLYHLFLLKRAHGLARELPSEMHEFYKKKYKDMNFEFLFLTDGFNMRNTELSAVLGRSQLKNLDKFINKRNKAYSKFFEIISKYPKFLYAPNNAGISSFCLPLVLKDAKMKTRLQKYLQEKGIETRPIISGNLLRQPFLKSYFRRKEFPNAEIIHTNGFYIGNNQFIDDKRIAKLAKFLENFSKTIHKSS